MRLGPMIEGNDTLLKYVASEREKEALLVVSPMARAAINKEIVPQLEESVTAVGDIDPLCEQTKEAIRTGFLAKNQVYTRLVSYKSIDQSDIQFLEDLLVVMDEWARKTKGRLENDAKDKDKDKKSEAVTVKVEVESDIHVKTDSSGPEVEVSVSPPKPSSPEGDEEEEVPSEMPYGEFFDQKEGTAENEEDVSTGSPAMLLFDLKDLRL